jgi:8-oxo-dGTP diphosphatase
MTVRSRGRSGAAAVPEFGEAVAGETYHLRPGSYGIVWMESSDRVALVATPRGLFLPGGGQDEDESLEATLRREAREECGLEVEVERLLGIADELTFVPEERRYCRKRCSFFRARVILEDPGAAIEPDHTLQWLDATAALHRLTHGSQRWAIALALREPRPEGRNAV